MPLKPYTLFPSLPGVYLFKSATKEILYIGKATSLKQRVSSYFKQQTNDWKIDALIKEHTTIDYILTNTPLEASLLEADLIKTHQPKYNILLKNGQPFVYILFTPETNNSYPTIKIVRNKKQKGSYFGPFLHKHQARSVYQFLIQTFRLNLCNKKIAHGCLDYHIGTCPGSCMTSFNKNEYLFHLQLAQNVLKNNDKQFTKTIKKKIADYCASLEFEKAQRLATYLEHLHTIFETIKTRYSSDTFAADIITTTTVPVDLTTLSSAASQELQQLLNLSTPIYTIDCFDISHFQSKNIVGSCIRFTHGIPDKHKFRRFAIKTITQQNDYAALQEAVIRRYNNHEHDFPDLIVIDGGKGQLNAVKQVVPSHTTCVSLAKREELLLSENHPHGIALTPHTHAGKLLLALRDYAHQFALTYHRLGRKKNLIAPQTDAFQITTHSNI